ncbi:MAG: zinc-ribbon domain-containing protein [Actinomycetota bacterium]|nr:zinc-ribbon domain-containing protein [Actinomycetota bacterium]
MPFADDEEKDQRDDEDTSDDTTSGDEDEVKTGTTQEPNLEDRGVDEEAKCPECGEPIENVRTTCPNCGYEYKEEDYTDKEAGSDFGAGSALDEKGEEKDVTGDPDRDAQEENEGGESESGSEEDK